MNFVKYLGIIVLFVAAAFYGMILLSPSHIDFRVNEDINVPIGEVYEGILNPKTWQNWTEGIENVKQIKGDGFSVGSVAEVYFPQDMIMTRTLRVATSNEQLVLYGEVKDFFSKTETYTLEALDSGTTRVSCTVKMKALKNKSKMILKAEETHRNNMAQSLIALKIFLEKG